MLRVPAGAPGELQRDWGQGMEGQDTGNGSHWERGDWAGILCRNCCLGGWGGAGLEFPALLWLPLDPWQCPRPGWILGLGAASFIGSTQLPTHSQTNPLDQVVLWWTKSSLSVLQGSHQQRELGQLRFSAPRRAGAKAGSRFSNQGLCEIHGLTSKDLSWPDCSKAFPAWPPEPLEARIHQLTVTSQPRAVRTFLTPKNIPSPEAGKQQQPIHPVSTAIPRFFSGSGNTGRVGRVREEGAGGTSGCTRGRGGGSCSLIPVAPGLESIFQAVFPCPNRSPKSAWLLLSRFSSSGILFLGLGRLKNRSGGKGD
ncbi:uncharacterized protein LOC134552564 [Prinia subflava]|uniref:uncharacterized protein LOC134552564 n=1 Tax=Prinia subflava TaxID=208062 RepID=UPI002FE1514E